jgi:general transcription factor 3C polypeptide 1
VQPISYINYSFFQVVLCLRLLKKFNPDEFKPKSTASNYKLGKKCLATDQIMELPLENSIYDMIQAKGTKGVTLVEVPLSNFQLGNFGVLCSFNDMLNFFIASRVPSYFLFSECYSVLLQ